MLARDPGAASALAPVAIDGRAEVIAFQYTAPVFERAAIPFHFVADDADPSQAASLLDRLRPDVLLTGTSRQAVRDAAWWAAAAARGIPSLAIVDHWDHYLERFTVERPFDHLPDRVAVMDDRARRALIGLGCPEDRLVVTGQPAFDSVLETPLVGREATRQQWGASDADWVILFASEPIASDYGGAHRYDESQALAVLLEATSALPARVFVRAHPRESPDGILSRFPGVRIDRTDAPQAAMAGADTVAGMTSIFLLEAALAGAPVLSIQPSADPEPVPGACSRLIALARTVGESKSWLEDVRHRGRLEDRERTARNLECGFTPGATARVLREAERLASR